jgi:predicted CXXCH cytochrome family protein
MRRRSLELSRFLLLVAVVLPFAACRDIVYRDRPLFDEPVAAAGGFVGYSNVERQMTVCGQCHISTQRRWEETAHAGAWQTIDTIAGAPALCRACHTTNERGNVATGTAGYLAHPDTRYHDVQCEACHGPGLEHVRSPERDNWPLAPMAVGASLTTGCGECHSGAHHPFVEQWAASRHANIRAGTPTTNVSCQGCHRGQQAAQQLGVRSEYLERNSATSLAITCGVCHDPHDASIPGQLRKAVDVYSEEENLCMQCHQRRARPDPAASLQGPHSPEGPLLLGLAGWFPPNMQFQPGEITSTHGSEEANPRLCAGCHVNQYEVRDRITNQFMFRSTGHTFEAIPCVDAEGVPSGSRTCGLTERTFATCTGSGCHGTPDIARTRLALVRDEIDGLIAAILAMEAEVPPGEFNAGDLRYSTAEGARFNRRLAEFRGSEVHNPALTKALLRASIRQLQQDYGVAPPPGTLSAEPGLN